MYLFVKKDEFLKHKENKQMWIAILGEKLEQCDIQVISASGDANLLIAKTAVEATSKSDTVIVGDDTYLLVLLLFCHKLSVPNNLYFMQELKKRFTTSTKVLEHLFRCRKAS